MEINPLSSLKRKILAERLHNSYKHTVRPPGTTSMNKMNKYNNHKILTSVASTLTCKISLLRLANRSRPDREGQSRDLLQTHSFESFVQQD